METQRITNLMRMQEDWSRRNNIRIDRIDESPKENWKDIDNKLYQMLYDYFDIAEGGVIERAR